MFINPEVAIREGWVVTGIEDPEKQLQPNALDFTLDRLFAIQPTQFVISEYGKQARNQYELQPSVDRRWKAEKNIEVNFWTLQQDAYDGLSNIYLNLPKGVAAFLIVRSTLNRNGLFLTSGLYDSGYQGHIGFVLHVRNRGVTRIAQGTRVGQVVFVESQNALMYAGGYNHEMGTHHSEEPPNRSR